MKEMERLVLECTYPIEVNREVLYLFNSNSLLKSVSEGLKQFNKITDKQKIASINTMAYVITKQKGEPFELPIRYDRAHWLIRAKARELYKEKQNNLCQHCKNDLDGEPSKEIKNTKIDYSLFPENMFKSNMHLHHNHDTGLTIGVVHSRCNAVLWQYYGE